MKDGTETRLLTPDEFETLEPNRTNCGSGMR